jgi:futalosine hydrolase
LDWRAGKLANPLPCAPLDNALVSGPFATISTMTQSAERIADFAGRGMLAENMEGAGVALACQLQGIPFSEVRAVSNFLGPRDPSLWQTEMALAALRKWLGEHLP